MSERASWAPGGGGISAPLWLADSPRVHYLHVLDKCHDSQRVPSGEVSGSPVLRELISFERQRCEPESLNSACLSSGLQQFTPGSPVERVCPARLHSPGPTGAQAGNTSRRDPQGVSALALPPGFTSLQTPLPTQVGPQPRSPGLSSILPSAPPEAFRLPEDGTHGSPVSPVWSCRTPAPLHRVGACLAPGSRSMRVFQQLPSASHDLPEFPRLGTFYAPLSCRRV